MQSFFVGTAALAMRRNGQPLVLPRAELKQREEMGTG